MQDDTAQLLPTGCTAWGGPTNSNSQKQKQEIPLQKTVASSGNVFSDDSAPVMSLPGLTVRTSCVGIVQGLERSAPRDLDDTVECAYQSSNVSTNARARAGSTSRPILRSEESGGMLPSLAHRS